MKKWNIDAALIRFSKLKGKAYVHDDLTETDTRSKLIDYVLKDCFGWTEDSISREERANETGTYLDYKLSTNRPLLIIEAKRTQVVFDLPNSKHREYVVGGVISQCDNLRNAMTQARDYAVSKGITFCVVTNGHQYIFFRSQNQQGIDWTDHRAIVFRSLDDVESNFSKFCDLLSNEAARSSAMHSAFPLSGSDQTDVDKYKTLDASHLKAARRIDRNRLYPVIGELVQKVFQDLGTTGADSEILEHCYVSSPQKQDKGTAYFDQASQSLKVSKKDAGDFQHKVLEALINSHSNKNEVILLLGTVGVGKSTFIQRFRKVLAKEAIDNDGLWIYFDFRAFSDTGASIDDFVCDQIERTLESEYANLELESWDFLKQVYHGEYERLKKGTLKPLYRKSVDDFDQEFGKKIDDIRQGNKLLHFQKVLATAQKRQNKKVFLVFDNADQLAPDTQNFIFLLAERITNDINCHSLLSMREESYWKNREAGPLNAFHTTSFQVQSAKLEQVISKRFNYSRNLISQGKITNLDQSGISNKELLVIFDRLVATVLGQDKTILHFIESVSSRNTRRALGMLAVFMISGHTNIDALIRDVRSRKPKELTVPFHEFLNSISLREHQHYSSDKSEILNIFDTYGDRSDKSNLNVVAVLGRILNAKNDKSDVGLGYLQIEEVVNDLDGVGILPETTFKILERLNLSGLVETETTIRDEMSASKYVRATVSGSYYLTELSLKFTYIDIVLPDVPIKGAAFARLNKIYTRIQRNKGEDGTSRLRRVKDRLELVDRFIKYLGSEFNVVEFRKHTDNFDAAATNFIPLMRKSFDEERKEIERNAEKIFKTAK